MKKLYFLGLNARRKGAFKHLFTHGSKKDRLELKSYLEGRFGGEAVLSKNGRSALALALMANFKRGDKILVNGFTCFAVYEAVKAAGCEPVFLDIKKNDLNMDLSVVKSINAKGIIIQNTLGNPVDIEEVEKFIKKHELILVEDLAHSAGVRYSDGREAGTVGAATVLSFGKEKAIDTVSGGAVIFRNGANYKTKMKSPKPSDYLRERWYPTFAAWARGLTRVHLGGIFMRALLKIHFVEKSADNRLDLTRRMPNFEAKLALFQLKNLKKTGEPPLRKFYLVRDREEVLRKLKKAGYYFDGFWYEKPVSPVRYYKKVHFNEAACPVATEVAAKIVNLPTFYDKNALKGASEIIKEYEDAK